MGLAGPHAFGTEFIQHVLLESQKVYFAHTKAQEAAPTTPYAQSPPMPGGPLVPHPLSLASSGRRPGKPTTPTVLISRCSTFTRSRPIRLTT